MMHRRRHHDDAAAVRLLPPLVPVATILAGIGLSKLWPIDLGLASAEPVLRLLGGAVIVASIGLGAWALVMMVRSGQHPEPWAPTPTILIRGPFRLSRNPMYLAMVLMCLGFAIRRLDVWILALTPVAIWLLKQQVILPEEEYLERKFGDSYLAYKSRVRRWL